MPDSAAVPILDLHPPAEDLRRQVLAGLNATPSELPCKLLYDDAGSDFFEQICDLPEYYQTRTEQALLQTCRDDVAGLVGKNAVIVEYGSGSTHKVRNLMESIDTHAYVPIDISRWYLENAAEELATSHPELVVRPVLADYTLDVPLPDGLGNGPRVGFFPGGTIGNFWPHNAVAFLRRVAATLGRSGYLLVGYDRKKDPALLHAAYNDSAGVTASFNLNLLDRLNATADATFDRGRWRHYAPYVPEAGRIEMWLVADEDQEVRVAGETLLFRRGEAIRTETSQKFSPEEFKLLATDAGFDVAHRWSDERQLFDVVLLQVS
jgi:dimethylhistidine N-methyltransferase